MKIFVAATLLSQAIISAKSIDQKIEPAQSDVQEAEFFTNAVDASALDLILSSAVVEGYKQTFGPAVQLADSFYKTTVTILLDLLTCKPSNMAPLVFYETVRDTIHSFAGPSGDIDKAVYIDEFLRKLREQVEAKSPVDLQGFKDLSNNIHRILINYPFITFGAYLEYISKVLMIIESLLDVPQPVHQPASIPLKFSPERMPLIKEIPINLGGSNESVFHPNIWNFNKYGFTGAIGSKLWTIPQNVHELFGDLIKSTHLLPFTIDLTPDHKWIPEQMIRNVSRLELPTQSKVFVEPGYVATRASVVDDGAELVTAQPMTVTYTSNIAPSHISGHHTHSHANQGEPTVYMPTVEVIERTSPKVEVVQPVPYMERAGSVRSSANNVIATRLEDAARKDNAESFIYSAPASLPQEDQRVGMSAPNAAVFGSWQRFFNPNYSGLNALGAYSTIRADFPENLKNTIKIVQVSETPTEAGTEKEDSHFIWSITDAAIYFLQKLEIFRPTTMDPELFLKRVAEIIRSSSKSITPTDFVKRISISFQTEVAPELLEQAVMYASNSYGSSFPHFGDVLGHIQHVIDMKLGVL